MPEGHEGSGSGTPLRPGDIGVALAVFLLSALVYAGLVFFMDNTNINTRNGSHIAAHLRLWVEGRPDREIFFANLLYYPVVGWGVRLLDEDIFAALDRPDSKLRMRIRQGGYHYGRYLLIRKYILGICRDSDLALIVMLDAFQEVLPFVADGLYPASTELSIVPEVVLPPCAYAYL